MALKTRITPAEYFQLVSLVTVARCFDAGYHQCVDAAAAVVGEEEHVGHMNDVCAGQSSLLAALDRLGIKVEGGAPQ